jgi:hypothetical protein
MVRPTPQKVVSLMAMHSQTTHSFVTLDHSEGKSGGVRVVSACSHGGNTVLPKGGGGGGGGGGHWAKHDGKRIAHIHKGVGAFNP